MSPSARRGFPKHWAARRGKRQRGPIAKACRPPSERRPKSSALRNAFSFYSLLARSDSGDPHREAVGSDGVLDLGNQFEVRDGSPRVRCRGRRDELDFASRPDRRSAAAGSAISSVATSSGSTLIAWTMNAAVDSLSSLQRNPHASWISQVPVSALGLTCSFMRRLLPPVAVWSAGRPAGAAILP